MEKELEERSLGQLLKWSKTMKLRARTKAGSDKNGEETHLGNPLSRGCEESG